MLGCSRNKALVLLALLASACSNKKSEVGTTVVEKGDLISRVTVSGLLVPARKTIVVAPYMGYVDKLFVQVGSKVRSGDPLVRVVQTLQGPSDQAYPIRAPFTGVVTNVFTREGESVENNRDRGSLLRLDDLSELWIEADLPEIDVTKVKIGMETLVRPSGDGTRTFRGELKTIALAAKETKDWDRAKIEFPIRVLLKEHDEILKPGMTVTIDIVVAKAEKVLTLRQEYVEKGSEKYFVTLASGERREIQLGLQNEEKVEIRSGLSENDRVRMVDFGGVGKSAGR